MVIISLTVTAFIMLKPKFEKLTILGNFLFLLFINRN